ncbi:MAG: FliG C-terminal domain-containing protein, partial [Pseudomonadota bacterium]
DIPKIMRVVDQAALTQIIAGAEGPDKEALDYILANISQRMADSLRAEAEEIARVAEPELEAAMGTVVQGVRDLVADGEIFLISGDD